MSFNYRVCVEREPDIVNPDEWVYSYSIRDVYYTDKGVPKSYGADPQFAHGESLQGIVEDMRLQAEALRKPVLFIFDKDIFTEPPSSNWLWESIPDTDWDEATPKLPKNFGKFEDELTQNKYKELKKQMEREQQQQNAFLNKQIQNHQMRAGAIIPMQKGEDPYPF